MNTTRIDPLIIRIQETVKRHRLDGEGAYARWLWQDTAGTRKLGINEYGCADAANILYTICALPGEGVRRDAWIKTLQDLQNPETGMFTEATHHPIHTTAHCVAALELFDAKPTYRLFALEPLLKKEGLYRFLEGLRWKEDPWPQSHQSAGAYAALKLAGMTTVEWENWYFDWLWKEEDPKTGLWRRDCVESGIVPVFHHMAGSFHLLFNHEYSKRPLRYPEQMIDTCLEMFEEHRLKERFGQELNFIEVDWVYCLNRASRQTTHRYRACKAALEKFADGYLDYLFSVDPDGDDEWNDLHMLFGVVCALAELQQALYGKILSERPLRLTLDRRPFI